MDKLASLRAFVKVVELGSFSEAGRQMRLSRSAVSKYVGDLEQSLGVRLMERGAHSLRLTEEGRVKGSFRATGIRPKCAQMIGASGIQLPRQMFEHLQVVEGTAVCEGVEPGAQHHILPHTLFNSFRQLFFRKTRAHSKK